mmetsp:Transcript_43843/g.56224  ORF Transcript_43843/g.56224 Transcript_43843/m.56224 type:complete len:745 (+) Transcript_43843:118-2352(+)
MMTTDRENGSNAAPPPLKSDDITDIARLLLVQKSSQQKQQSEQSVDVDNLMSSQLRTIAEDFLSNSDFHAADVWIRKSNHDFEQLFSIVDKHVFGAWDELNDQFLGRKMSQSNAHLVGPVIPKAIIQNSPVLEFSQNSDKVPDGVMQFNTFIGIPIHTPLNGVLCFYSVAKPQLLMNKSTCELEAQQAKRKRIEEEENDVGGGEEESHKHRSVTPSFEFSRSGSQDGEETHQIHQFPSSSHSKKIESHDNSSSNNRSDNPDVIETSPTANGGLKRSAWSALNAQYGFPYQEGSSDSISTQSSSSSLHGMEQQQGQHSSSLGNFSSDQLQHSRNMYGIGRSLGRSYSNDSNGESNQSQHSFKQLTPHEQLQRIQHEQEEAYRHQSSNYQMMREKAFIEQQYLSEQRGGGGGGGTSLWKQTLHNLGSANGGHSSFPSNTSPPYGHPSSSSSSSLMDTMMLKNPLLSQQLSPNDMRNPLMKFGMKMPLKNPLQTTTRRNGSILHLCRMDGCEKLAQGSTSFCIAHGGGNRCVYPNCKHGARDKFLCATHGGGKRCAYENCTKAAVGKYAHCTAHGGGRRCEEPGCTKAAQSNTKNCVRHGGGKRCTIEGCKKVARGKTNFCTLHFTEQQQQQQQQLQHSSYHGPSFNSSTQHVKHVPSHLMAKHLTAPSSSSSSPPLSSNTQGNAKIHPNTHQLFMNQLNFSQPPPPSSSSSSSDLFMSNGNPTPDMISLPHPMKFQNYKFDSQNLK